MKAIRLKMDRLAPTGAISPTRMERKSSLVLLARTARRKVRVRVTVRRDGKKIRVWREKTIRVLLEPHVVYTFDRKAGALTVFVDGQDETVPKQALGAVVAACKR